MTPIEQPDQLEERPEEMLPQEETENTNHQSSNQGARLPIVGMGASAGGLAALQAFFEALPPNTGMAFVVVTHMDPERESLLPELLQNHTEMKIHQVLEEVAIEPNHIYVLPPNRRIVVTDAHLDVEEFTEPRGRRSPIDYFFRSLAEREIQDQDGCWLLVRHHPYLTPENRIDGVVLTLIDINALKQTEKELRESERVQAQEVGALRRLHEMTSHIVVSFDMQRALEEILATSLEILRADLGSVQLLDQERRILTIVAQSGFEQSFLEKFREIDDKDDTTFGRALRYGRRVIVEDVETDAAYEPYLDIAAKAGYRAVQSTPLINHQSQIVGILSTHYRQPTSFSERDKRFLDLLAYQAANLIERLWAEEQLEQRVLERTTQVRRLASEIITLEQTVRQRIAQSLHDNLQQSLYAAKIQLQFLRDEVGEKEEISQLNKTISHSLDLTRQMTAELSPPVLEDEGLPEALNWLAEHMHELYGLRVHVKTSDYLDTATKEQRVLLYQIVQELLFNVVKHAGVQEAELLLQEKDEALMVIVSDHGRGFDVAEKTADTSAGFGLRSIHERLQLFDGWAELNSQPGAGTRVHLFLPHHRSTE
jgi:signal transduction histidine kinase